MSTVEVLSWARLIDAGLAQVDRLDSQPRAYAGDPVEGPSMWVIRSADGSVLVTVEARESGGYTMQVFRPGRRPPGGTSAMHEWVRDWTRWYLGPDVHELLVDLAALAG